MAGETKRFYHATTTTLEANGGSITNASTPVQANDSSLDLGAYTAPADYPHVRFVLSCGYSVAPTVNSAIELIARELDIDSTNDAQAPDATFRQRIVGFFTVDDVTATQYMVIEVYDVPRKADYYLYNGTGQTISAGWTLKATPFTFGPV